MLEDPESEPSVEGSVETKEESVEEEVIDMEESTLEPEESEKPHPTGRTSPTSYDRYTEDYYCAEEVEQEFENGVQKGQEVTKEPAKAGIPYRSSPCSDDPFRREELVIPGSDPEWVCKPDPCEKIPENLGANTSPGGFAFDPIRTQLAYGEMALTRLDNELQGTNLDIKIIATIMLCEYLFDPENIERAYRAGILNTLRNLLLDRDKIVREKSAECIRIIANHPFGCTSLLQVNVIPGLEKLLDDYHSEARKNGHRALERMSEYIDGARAIVKAELIQKLITCLQRENEETQNLILETLHYCSMQDTKQALQCNAMEVLKNFLLHESENIRWKTARVVLDLSVPIDGKLAACQHEIIFPLVKLLSDSNACVRAKAAGALMMITIVTEGKFMALKANAIDPLLELLEDVKFEGRINAIKALTNIAEAPKGRETLLWSISKFQQCLQDGNPSVRTAAVIAIKVIQWVP